MNRENERMEYKLLGTNGKLPDSLIKEVVAFVNSDGGEIYVGIADDGAIKEMLMQTSGRSYESARSIEQNLTFDALKKEFGENQMKTLHLIGSDELYTNLALLLSDQCPFTTKVAVFEENDPLIFQDRREMTGSILTQLDDVLAYVDQYNKTHAQVGAKYREDKKDYPPEAIREALLNCIVHRDYSFSGSNIINIYDDHMEFISIGSLLPGISMQSVMRGLSQSRNKNLAELFYRLRLVESYGTGIKKIIKLFEGYKAPEFATEEGGFFVTMYSKNKTKKKTQKPPQLQGSEELIMESVNKNGYVTRIDVEEMLNVKQTRAYTFLKKLCDKGELEAVSEGKNTKYIKAAEANSAWS